MTTKVTQVSTMTNAADALAAEEIKRTRVLLRAGWVAGLVVAIAVVIAPGDRRLAVALLSTIALGLATSAWMLYELRDPTKFRPTSMTVLSLVAVTCGVLGLIYTGTFSAAPVGLVLCIYFFCRSESLPAAIVLYVIAAASHGITTFLVIGGVIPEPGFYPVSRHVSAQALVTGHLLLQMAYALCFWLARVTRKVSLRSIEHLQRATRLAAQRDVQLAELRNDLDRVLKIGGPGRFSGVLVGEWELGNVIGRGAMGEVYDAKHGKRDETAAVKLLRRELLADSRHVERFLREVRVAGAIDSPHVVKVLGASTPDDPMPFLAMEKLAGQTLSKLLRDGKQLADAPLASLIEQVGSVLEAARKAGIVHRDIKPQNLFLTYDNVWKVLDFGVALLAQTTGTLTRGGAIGTPAYMAPEQARGEVVDHRADIYAFGAVLYRAITGRAPFAAKDTPSLLYAVTHDMPLRPSSLVTIAPALETFLHLALAKDKQVRLQSGAEVIAAFQAARAGALPDELTRRAALLPPWKEPPPPLG